MSSDRKKKVKTVICIIANTDEQFRQKEMSILSNNNIKGESMKG